MRTILLLPLFLVIVPAAHADYAKQTVGYECKNIDAKRYGFSCSISKGALHLHWYENLKQMPQSRREAASYTGKMLMLRYYEAGGNTVVVTSNHWTKIAAKLCSPTPSRRGSICQVCKSKDKAGNYTDCDI